MFITHEHVSNVGALPVEPGSVQVTGTEPTTVTRAIHVCLPVQG